VSDAQVKLLAVGDMMLRTLNCRPPFGHVGDILHAGDILFGNVETVLSDRGQAVKKAIHLETSPNSVRHLQEAGFDVVSVANNHVITMFWTVAPRRFAIRWRLCMEPAWSSLAPVIAYIPNLGELCGETD